MLNEKKFRSIYDDFLSSGLSTRDYYANQNMNEAKFYYWQNKLKAILPPKKGFVPVVFQNEKQQTSSFSLATQNKVEVPLNSVEPDHSISCEVSYPSGVCIKLQGLTNLQMLHSLLLQTNQ